MLRRRHLGRVSFAEANDLQRALLQASDDYVLLFEHPPTYTRGVRTLEEHFLIPPSELNAVVIDADRGGDVTYHAPGQVVAWAIVTVDDDPAAGKTHVRHLEDAVIDAVTARRFAGSSRRGRSSRRLSRGVGRPHGSAEENRRGWSANGAQRRLVLDERCTAWLLTSISISRASKPSCPAESPISPSRRLRSLGVDVTSIEVEELLGEELERHLGGRVTRRPRGSQRRHHVG